MKLFVLSALFSLIASFSYAQSDSDLMPLIERATEEYHRNVFGDKSGDWTPTTFRSLEDFTIFKKSAGSSSDLIAIEFDVDWKSSSSFLPNNSATLVLEIDENGCQARVRKKNSGKWYRIGCIEL